MDARRAELSVLVQAKLDRFQVQCCQLLQEIAPDISLIGKERAAVRTHIRPGFKDKFTFPSDNLICRQDKASELFSWA